MQKGLAPILIIFLVVVSAVGGYFVYTNYSKIQTQPAKYVQTTPAPTTKPESTSSADMTDWKTYTNDEYGFSFQYPLIYQLKENTKVGPYAVAVIVVEDTSKIGTISNVTGGPFMHITIILNQSSISDFINDPQNDLLLTGEEDLEPNSFTIARKRIGQESGAPSKYYLVKHGNRIIEILNSPGYPLDKSIFNQILSTFRFD